MKIKETKLKQLLLYNRNPLGLFCTLWGEACSAILRGTAGCAGYPLTSPKNPALVSLVHFPVQHKHQSQLLLTSIGHEFLQVIVTPLPFPHVQYFPRWELCKHFYSVNTRGQWGAMMHPGRQLLLSVSYGMKFGCCGKRKQQSAFGQWVAICYYSSLSPTCSTRELNRVGTMQNSTSIGQTAVPAEFFPICMWFGSPLTTVQQWKWAGRYGLQAGRLHKDQYTWELP